MNVAKEKETKWIIMYVGTNHNFDLLKKFNGFSCFLTSLLSFWIAVRKKNITINNLTRGHVLL